MGIEVASSFTRKSPVPLDDSRSVADLTARDAIASGIRYIGMDVFVASEGVWYTLIGIIVTGKLKVHFLSTINSYKFLSISC